MRKQGNSNSYVISVPSMKEVPPALPTGVKPMLGPKLSREQVFSGTKSTPEVCRALRKVIRDHSFIDLKPTREIQKDTAPSIRTVGLWLMIIAGLVIAGAIVNKPRDTESSTKTYTLQPG
jgi:hypothetical protein